jgi:hypothetical protein
MSPPSSGLKSQASAGVFLGLFLNPEDRSDMFFRNVRLLPNYTALSTHKTELCRMTAVKISNST